MPEGDNAEYERRNLRPDEDPEAIARSKKIFEEEQAAWEKRQAELDKIWPRLEEPDEEGIDFHPADPRRRFIAVAEGTIFRDAAPLTPEEEAEADALWGKVTGGAFEKKKEKK